MDKTTQTDLTLTDIFAEHCKILLEDISATATNHNKKMAKRITAVGEALVTLYASIFEISFYKADDYLYILACGGADERIKAKKELIIDPQDHILGKFSDCVNKNIDDECKYGIDIATEVTTIYAEWKRMSYDAASNLLCSVNRREVTV